jgi:hypothetical protein
MDRGEDSEGSQEGRIGENTVTDSISPRMHDRLQHNIARNPRAEGFLGGASTVRWMDDVARMMVPDLER